MDANVLRILDANANRAREALRVLEEYVRFALSDAAMTERIKRLRHDLVAAARRLPSADLLSARAVDSDVGVEIGTPSERVRADAAEVAVAAARRAGEALRSLEEYSKIIDPETASAFESLRYAVYKIEQDVLVGGPRRQRLRRARLHVLVTEALCRGPWEDVCRAALDAGADVIQLREKALADREFLRRAYRLREFTRAAGALLFINDRADIARLSGADGVHVGQEDLSVADARRIAGPGVLVGKSTHSNEELAAALGELPDYVAVGPMFASQTKPEVRVRGPGLVDETLRQCELPVVAIGGIDVSNVAQLPRDTRVQVAVSQGVIAAVDAGDATRRLLAIFSES